jgi:hypothetical protein
MDPVRGAVGLVLTLALSGTASAESPPAESAATPGSARLSLALWRPMAIAVQKLEDPRCASVLEDFRGADGATLAAGLLRRARTPAEHLRAITFVADSGGLCRQARIMAWTTPGASRVVICIENFEFVSRRNPRLAATVLIHELLHTLGLPERPPSSESITSGVAARCGR